MSQADHTLAFQRAKEAQNNIVEEKRIRYWKKTNKYIEGGPLLPGVIIKTPSERMSDEDFDAWYNEEFEKSESKYIVLDGLSGSQRHLAESTIRRLECLLEVGWVMRGDG